MKKKEYSSDFHVYNRLNMSLPDVGIKLFEQEEDSGALEFIFDE